MTLAEIPDGAAVFIDANVFVYHFAGASPQCTRLLARCETNEVRGATSALVLAEVDS
jgi:predicted nucleic acid-binding protein